MGQRIIIKDRARRGNAEGSCRERGSSAVVPEEGGSESRGETVSKGREAGPSLRVDRRWSVFWNVVLINKKHKIPRRAVIR